MSNNIDLKEALWAKEITWQTCIGTIMFPPGWNDYPMSSGNCFSVETVDGEHFRIVNFVLENMEELNKRGVNFPIKILKLSEKSAIIHDERIPNEWYRKRWCEVCCEEECLPIQQRLLHDLEEKQGVRTRTDNLIWIKPGNSPKV